MLTPRNPGSLPTPVVNRRTLRVMCSCGEGYFVPWHERDRSLYYRCLACEARLDRDAHREIKDALLAALEQDRSDVAYCIADESALRPDRPKWKRRR